MELHHVKECSVRRWVLAFRATSACRLQGAAACHMLVLDQNFVGGWLGRFGGGGRFASGVRGLAGYLFVSSSSVVQRFCVQSSSNQSSVVEVGVVRINLPFGCLLRLSWFLSYNSLCDEAFHCLFGVLGCVPSISLSTSSRSMSEVRHTTGNAWLELLSW